METMVGMGKFRLAKWSQSFSFWNRFLLKYVDSLCALNSPRTAAVRGNANARNRFSERKPAWRMRSYLISQAF